MNVKIIFYISLLIVLFHLNTTINAESFIYCKGKTEIFKKENIYIKIISYKANFNPYTVFVLPPSRGKNVLDTMYATNICKNDVNTVIIEKWNGSKYLGFPLDSHQQFFEQAIMVIKATMEHTKSSEIGLLGTSAGGIIAAIATHLIPEVKKTFVIAGGAGIASVIAHSDHRELTRLKKERMMVFDFKNEKEYEHAVQEHFFLDPLDLPLDRQNKKLGMLLIDYDETVPSQHQNLLLELWQPDVAIRYRRTFLGKLIYDNHLGGIVESFVTYNDRITHFF